MTGSPPRDPLEGVTLERMLNELVDHFGWPEVGQQIAIRTQQRTDRCSCY
jgi:uncharacterized protein (DUF2132 family)